MRTIYLLRGTPASGKSTWIENNKLQQYTLSADNIRLMYQSPVLNNSGEFVITQQNDGKVWQFLFEMLEDRMRRGEFVIVDATHYKSELLNRYRNLISKYRYRAFVVDFTNIPLETLLERNKNRDVYKRVPEETIRKMYAVFEQDTEVSNKFNVITPKDAINKLYEPLIYDYNKYDKVVFFGDIHGCYEPIKTYFEQNPFNDNYAYIFLGDYIDRGIQNKEVLEFLLSIKDKSNVLLLEGNHEKWLRLYAEDNGAEIDVDRDVAKTVKKYLGSNALYRLRADKICSSEFIKNTIPQIESLSHKDLRQLCRKFGQMAYITYRDKEYFACHGGLPTLPSIFVSTEEMIKGVGKYEDLDSIYNSWNSKGFSTTLIHGHRNIFDFPAKYKDNVYNLCSNIEFGENLRVLEIDSDGKETVKEIPNPVYNEKCQKIQEKVDKLETKTDNEILKSLNESKLIQKKILKDGIISYNFKHNVFHNRIWNNLTCKARGLFIDAKTEKVIARSYDKFFNWSELDETKSENLKKNLKFPVVAYKKYNGFLAMVSWNWNKKDLLVCSKSTNEGEFVELIKNQLNKLSRLRLINLKHYLQVHNCTLIFECIDKDNDPHIIKYDENKLVLLDVIRNNFDTLKLPFEDINFVSNLIGIESKQKEYVFNTWEELYAFKKQQDESYDTQHEGWVFEDANGFMVKYKTRFYKFWKQMRAVKERLQNGNNVKKIFTTENEVRVFNILKSIEPEKLKEMSIIDIEDIFYNQYPELKK